MKTYEEFLADFIHYNLLSELRLKEIRQIYTYANGCGAKGSFKVPATMWGVNIESACIIHDLEWVKAKNVDDLHRANENFDNNLKKICDKESNAITVWFRRMRIAKYVSGVELVGTVAYAKERGFI